MSANASVRLPRPGEKPTTPWCWCCSRRLRLPYYRVLLAEDGHEHAAHAECASAWLWSALLTPTRREEPPR